jgi:hypothetical protein
MVERSRGEVLWFDPHSKDDIARKLTLFHEKREELVARARAQVATLASASWDEVAREYASILGLPPAHGPEPISQRAES